jgi:hypothetical protein
MATSKRTIASWTATTSTQSIVRRNNVNGQEERQSRTVIVCRRSWGRRKVGSEVDSLIEGGKWQRQAELGNLDRRIG